MKEHLKYCIKGKFYSLDLLRDHLDEIPDWISSQSNVTGKVDSLSELGQL